MICQNFLGTLCAYTLYLFVVLFFAYKKKMGFRKSLCSGLRLLLVFVLVYAITELAVDRVAPEVFFSLAFGSFIFVFLVDMVLAPFIGISSFDLLGSFVFWESKEKREADAIKIHIENK